MIKTLWNLKISQSNRVYETRSLKHTTKRVTHNSLTNQLERVSSSIQGKTQVSWLQLFSEPCLKTQETLTKVITNLLQLTFKVSTAYVFQ